MIQPDVHVQLAPGMKWKVLINILEAVASSCLSHFICSLNRQLQEKAFMLFKMIAWHSAY